MLLLLAHLVVTISCASFANQYHHLRTMVMKLQNWWRSGAMSDTCTMLVINANGGNCRNLSTTGVSIVGNGNQRERSHNIAFLDVLSASNC
jgi:hypothetical protein